MIKGNHTFFLDLLKIIYYYVNSLFSIIYKIFELQAATCHTYTSLVIYRDSDIYNCIRKYRFIHKDFYNMKYLVIRKTSLLDIEAGIAEHVEDCDIFINLEHETESMYITTATRTPFGDELLRLLS